MESSAPDTDRIDVELMLKVKSGDLDAFEELVERNQHRVVGTVAKMLGDCAEAEDIAQQVFVRVWKSAARYEPTAKFGTWLMTIARRLVFNESRRRSRHLLLSVDEAQAAAVPKQFADEGQPSPAQMIEDAELAAAVDAAIAALPEQQRLAVVLRRYEDMPYDEIAKVLSTSVSAVKSLLFRARADLRERLKGQLAD